jgi:hypothetical protein
MKRFTILLFGFHFICNTCSPITIRGTVMGSRKQAMPELVVFLTTVDHLHVLRNTLTDSGGNYRLDYSGIEDSLQIGVLGFNIEKQSRMVSAQSQQLTIQVVEKDIRIQEVTIHPKQIWRSKDTVNYLVSRFTQYDDLTIAAVLRQLPNFNVLGDGTVQYLDKPIYRFSIENVDLARDRFGLATNLLKPQDVFVIQVFKKRTVQKNRHIVQIAINLRMK